MSNLVSRYSKRYAARVQHDAISEWPKHVFMRSSQSLKTKIDRIGDRDSTLEATLLYLNERFEGKEVYLVGTMNNSTMMAQRTK